MDTINNASMSFAHSGNVATSLSASRLSNSQPWIIDSEDSDRMTGISTLLCPYHTCSSKGKVRVVECSLFSILGKVSIHVTPQCHFLLCYIFLISQLTSFLLAELLRISTIVFLSFSLYLITRKTIGSGR